MYDVTHTNNVLDLPAMTKATDCPAYCDIFSASTLAMTSWWHNGQTTVYVHHTSSGTGSTLGEKKLFLPPGGMSAAVRSFTKPGICWNGDINGILLMLTQLYSTRIEWYEQCTSASEASIFTIFALPLFRFGEREREREREFKMTFYTTRVFQSSLYLCGGHKCSCQFIW